jgi:hypothetical protein
MKWGKIYSTNNLTGSVVPRNIEARSHNHCCRGKAISFIYSKGVHVTLVIQHATLSVACQQVYSDSLLSGRSGNRIPLGARFSAPVRTGPTSYTMDTGSFEGKKRPGRGNHTHPSSVEVKERVELYLYSPSVPLWHDIGWNLPLPLPYVSRLAVPGFFTLFHKRHDFRKNFWT